MLTEETTYDNHFNYSFRIKSHFIEIKQYSQYSFELRIDSTPFKLLILEEKNASTNQDAYYNHPRAEIRNKTGFSFKSNGNKDDLVDNDNDDLVDNDNDDFNREDSTKYYYHNTEPGPKRQLKRINYFEGQGNKGHKQEDDYQYEERHKSKCVQETKSNTARNLGDLIDSDTIDDKKHNRYTNYSDVNLRNTISFNNNRPQNRPIAINATIQNNNINNIENFFSNNNRAKTFSQDNNESKIPLSYNSNLIQTNNYNNNNNNNNLNNFLLPNPLSQTCIGNYNLNNQRTHQHFRQLSNNNPVNLQNYTNQVLRHSLQPKIILNNPIQEYYIPTQPCSNLYTQPQSNIRYQDLPTNANDDNYITKSSFETNGSASTYQSNYQAQKPSSGLVDFNNILGNQHNENKTIEF